MKFVVLNINLDFIWLSCYIYFIFFIWNCVFRWYLYKFAGTQLVISLKITFSVKFHFLRWIPFHFTVIVNCDCRKFRILPPRSKFFTKINEEVHSRKLPLSITIYHILLVYEKTNAYFDYKCRLRNYYFSWFAIGNHWSCSIVWSQGNPFFRPHGRKW